MSRTLFKPTPGLCDVSSGSYLHKLNRAGEKIIIIDGA
jgi:hypothetical protein